MVYRAALIDADFDAAPQPRSLPDTLTRRPRPPQEKEMETEIGIAIGIRHQKPDVGLAPQPKTSYTQNFVRKRAEPQAQVWYNPFRVVFCRSAYPQVSPAAIHIVPFRGTPAAFF